MDSTFEELEDDDFLLTDADGGDDDGLHEHYRWAAAKGQTMMRVDKFIVTQHGNMSRTKIQHAADLQMLHANGKPVKSSYKVKPLDVITLMLPYPPPPALQAEDIPLEIAYEDEDILIVNKEPNMVCHPGVGNHTGTLVHALLWHFEHLPPPTLPQNQPRPGLVHRIDKGTSGNLVIAKTEFAMADLCKQFFDRTTDRIYYAVVWGNVKADAGTVTGNIGRSTKDRKVFMVYTDGVNGKHAVTHYTVLERFGGVATLVQCKLETGRTHQIRVHMKHIGHTLLGDAFYGGDKPTGFQLTQKLKQFTDNCLEIMQRQALHAKSLALTHPITGERMLFESELPSDFVQLLEKLRNYARAV